MWSFFFLSCNCRLAIDLWIFPFFLLISQSIEYMIKHIKKISKKKKKKTIRCGHKKYHIKCWFCSEKKKKLIKKKNIWIFKRKSMKFNRFKVCNIWIGDLDCGFFFDSFCRVALYPFGFPALTCRMRHQRPYVFWLMFQQMECRIVLQPSNQKEKKNQLINFIYWIGSIAIWTNEEKKTVHLWLDSCQRPMIVNHIYFPPIPLEPLPRP